MMKKDFGVKKSTINRMPRYKAGIPIILCVYMVMSLFASGMEQKTLLLSMATIGMGIWYVGERIFPDYKCVEEKKTIHKLLLGLMGVFLGMTILSELCSKDYSTTLQGDSDSVLGILGYIVLFYMAYTYSYIEKNQRILKRGISIIAVIVVTMSVLEFLDMPIAKIWLGNVELLKARNRVVLSFGNSNYYGIFCCMLIPFVLEMWLCSKEKMKKCFYILLSGVMVCCVFMSKSTAAVYLMLAIIVALCLYEYRRVCKQWLWFIVFIIVVGGIGVLFDGVSNGKLYELTKIGVSNADAFVEEGKALYKVKEISLEGERLIIEGTDNSFIVEYDGTFTFYDEEKNILDIENDGNRIFFTERPYNLLSLDVSLEQKTNRLLVEIDAGYKDTIDFYIEEGCFKGVGADGTVVDDISGRTSKQTWNSLFTGRGYIWANTLPLLKEVVFIGKGYGNFVHTFKQYDYVGLLESQGTHKLIIDRPHNMFLQYSVDVGMIGTISLFILFAVIVFGWIRSNFINGRESNTLSVASFFSVVEYLVFMLLNDSLIVISPYFWVFLGITISLQNRKGH